MDAPGQAQDNDASQPRDGAIAKLVKKLFLRHGNVVAVERLSQAFMCIGIQGEGLKHVQWTPGDKIQLNLGAGFSKRTYTPISWDAGHGMMTFLAYLHGQTPACRFLLDMQPGMPVQFLGPRASLDLSEVAPHPVLFGDETCLGLAAALTTVPNGKQASFIFEVSHEKEARAALLTLGITGAILIERKPDAQHLGAVGKEMQAHAQPGSPFILSGNASSIQAIKKTLLAAGIANPRMKAKAYWATGRNGLD